MPELEKLKPCPFCGRLSLGLDFDSDFGEFYVRCGRRDCNTEGPRAVTKEEAIKKWNRRAEVKDDE